MNTVLRGSSISDGYIGYEVTSYMAGSVMTSGYVYLNLSTDYTEKQIQTILVDNAGLYKDYGLLVDRNSTSVLGMLTYGYNHSKSPQ